MQNMDYDWKKGIYDILQNAGSAGLQFDDIKNILGIKDNNAVQGILTELHNQYLVEVTPTQHYRVISDYNYSNTLSNMQYGFCQNITPMNYTPKSAVPVIYLPGTSKFCSYKNSLQEYCQKSRIPTPSYKVVLNAPGEYVGSVSFNNNLVQATVGHRSVKEAEHHAAFDALKQLGYLAESSMYIPISGTKRPNSSQDSWYSKKPKQMAVESNKCSSFKSKLNELAQKRHLDTPIYQTVFSSSGYLSTVTFNGREFKSISSYLKKKDAEQNAALVAYNFLTNDLSSLSSSDFREDPTKKVKEKSYNTSEPSTCLSTKNRLQEYCQRLKKPLPQYATNLNKDMTSVSVVTVEGIQYQGEAKSFKKEAEMSAASVALKALGLAI